MKEIIIFWLGNIATHRGNLTIIGVRSKYTATVVPIITSIATIIGVPIIVVGLHIITRTTPAIVSRGICKLEIDKPFRICLRAFIRWDYHFCVPIPELEMYVWWEEKICIAWKVSAWHTRWICNLSSPSCVLLPHINRSADSNRIIHGLTRLLSSIIRVYKL